MLREDTNALPAEITEEDLKNFLKNVARSDKESVNQKQQKVTTLDKSKQLKEAQAAKKLKEKQLEEEQRQQGIGKDGKPIWNYNKNMKGRKNVPNSMKDPFYNERAKFIEERRQKRLEFYQGQAEKNGQKYNEFVQRKQNQNQNQNQRAQQHDDNFSTDDYRDDYRTNRNSVMSSMSNTSNANSNQVDYRKSNLGNNNKQTESILNLLTKNLASNPIYEEDEDLYLNNQNKNVHKRQVNNSNLDDGYSNRGFVPFLRTNEVLDPVHAGSPIPPSRESTAVKRDREKARQVSIRR